jgi:hypothetical protein
VGSGMMTTQTYDWWNGKGSTGGMSYLYSYQTSKVFIAYLCRSFYPCQN